MTTEATKIEVNNKNPAGLPPGPTQAPGKKSRFDEDAIPVIALYASSPTGIPLGAKNLQQIASGKPRQQGADAYEVTYLPRMGVYRVRVTFGDSNKGGKSYLVPRELATAEVAE